MMLMDEGTAIGKLPILETSSAYLPGFNVRVVMIVQTWAQLRARYGREAADTLLTTLRARIVFAPQNLAEAQELSEELGYRSEKVKSISKPLWQLEPRSQCQ